MLDSTTSSTLYSQMLPQSPSSIPFSAETHTRVSTYLKNIWFLNLNVSILWIGKWIAISHFNRPSRKWCSILSLRLWFILLLVWTEGAEKMNKAINSILIVAIASVQSRCTFILTNEQCCPCITIIDIEDSACINLYASVPHTHDELSK